MTPRLRALIIVAATVIGLANMVLPLVSDYESEGGVAVAVIGLYGVALGVPEIGKRRGNHGSSGSGGKGGAGEDDEGGDSA